jgi:hypothetical protein
MATIRGAISQQIASRMPIKKRQKAYDRGMAMHAA